MSIAGTLVLFVKPYTGGESKMQSSRRSIVFSFLSGCAGAILAASLMVEASLASECAGLRPEAKAAWEAALKQSDAGHAQWATGDASAIKKLWANTDDVSIFGGLGAYERGWDQVGARLDWSATQFSAPASGNTDWKKEIVTAHVCNDISIATQIEQFTARMEPAKDERRRFVRVTLVWRNGPDGWKIVHRHGDALQPRHVP